MRKNKLLLLLALLLTAATGAWATDVYVVGNGNSDGNWVNGAIWDPGVAGNKMTEQNGVYSITFKDVDANSELLFKFAINGSWDVNYGCTSTDANELNKTLSNIDATGGMNFKFALTEKADVTISFNLSEMTYMISTKGMKVGDDAATGYTVSMKDGVKDADKWTVKVGEGQAQALPIGGLKGDGSETVTLQYTGRLKVKGVKATSEAAEASVPDGAINGKFSVSDGKQVYFSKGNLRYASSKWSFFDNQYDYYNSYSADAWDHFGWSTSATDYGKNTSTTRSDYSGDFVDWGATMGTGWRTLTSDEWTYLLKTRSASTVGGTENGRYAKAKVNDVKGVILFPDTYTHPDGVTAPTGVNATDATGWNGNSYTAADWTKMETAGCVFLPAAGYRNGSSVNNPGSCGDYSSATPSGTDKAYELYFSSSSLNPASLGSRFYGLSVRLVSEVTTSDAPAAKEPATVTTAPTGAAIVGVGKTTALVSGGAADGGTMMYKVTTTNTKPASTDGFSEAVPTAQGITASGKVYVWYYVKGDGTHSDSEIAATAIEVPVADIVWDATNVSELEVQGDFMPYENEGVTLSANSGSIFAFWNVPEDPTKAGISFEPYESGGFTFTAPDGKAFKKIVMKAQSSAGWGEVNLGDGWTFVGDDTNNIYTVTWKDSAASSVELLPDTDDFSGALVKCIGFYLSE